MAGFVSVPGKFATLSVGNGVTNVTPAAGFTAPVFPAALVETLKSVSGKVPAEGFVNPDNAKTAGVLAARVQPVPVVMVISPAEGELTATVGAVHGFVAKPETVVKVVDAGIETPAKLTVIVDVAVRAADAVKPISHDVATPAAVVVGAKVTPVTAADALTSKPTTETIDATRVSPMKRTTILFRTDFNTERSTFSRSSVEAARNRLREPQKRQAR